MVKPRPILDEVLSCAVDEITTARAQDGDR